MKIDPANRKATLGVREVSEFEVCPRQSGRPSGRWRAEAGRVWHESIQSESRAEFERERPVSGEIQRAGWILRIDGRCDLFRREKDGTGVFGEIKTVTDPLPLPASELRARFPAYFRQLALYLLLANQTDAVGRSFVLFLNIDSGIRQTVSAGSEDLASLESQLDSLIGFLDFTAERVEARASLHWNSFREHPREGQPAASASLARAEQTHRMVGFQAPTGFGKTRIVLEHALEAIRASKADRILYLTGKTSGQEQACIEARHLFAGSGGLRTYRLRNHREHWANCPVDGCLSDQCAPPPTERTALPVSELLRGPGHAKESWEHICALAQSYHQCPYSLSRGLLPLSELWIADYNYLFAPASRHIIAECPGYDPSRTWLLIDEAHNLPERVASALGGQLDARLLANAAADLREYRTEPKLPATLRELAHEIQNLPGERVVDDATLFLVSDLLEIANEALINTALPWRDLTGETHATLKALASALFLLERSDLHPLLWTPVPGRIEWLPLEPGPWIQEALTEFAQTVFFSATLDPFPSLVGQLGLAQEQCTLVRAEPETTGRFRTAIDARVQTTLRARGKHASKTAESLQQLAESSQGCVAAFFPSFEYARIIHTYLEAIAPHLQTAIQPRDINADEREKFSRTAPLSHDVLFLMLGGSFAEAVDAFGGVVETAMIVGPALPELSALNRIRMTRYPEREAGFHEVCRIPGMRRVNQAIGRLVRSLEHRATIVLHDERFLEPEYRQLLRSDLGQIATLRTDAEWHKWLQQ